jgi:hypothetical protein
MTKLGKLQTILTNRAFDVYRMMGEDLPLLQVEYISHYMNLGKLIYEINNYGTLGGLIDDLYKCEFSELGIADDEDVDDLLGDIFE